MWLTYFYSVLSILLPPCLAGNSAFPLRVLSLPEVPPIPPDYLLTIQLSVSQSQQHIIQYTNILQQKVHFHLRYSERGWGKYLKSVCDFWWLNLRDANWPSAWKLLWWFGEWPQLRNRLKMPSENLSICILKLFECSYYPAFLQPSSPLAL